MIEVTLSEAREFIKYRGSHIDNSPTTSTIWLRGVQDINIAWKDVYMIREVD